MKRIVKYKDWLSTIGLILFIVFSRRLLDNEWAVYAGQTLIIMGLNLEFLNDKREDERSVSTILLPRYSSLDYG